MGKGQLMKGAGMSEKECQDVVGKFFDVAEYWVNYCVEVKGADPENEVQMAEVYKHLLDNYAKVEEAYDLAMLKFVSK